MRTTSALAVALLLVLSVVGVPTAAGITGPSASDGTVGTAPAPPVDASPDSASLHSAPFDSASTASPVDPGDAETRTQESDACAPVSGGSPREDPDEDQLGWESGCWYDEPLRIDRSDGLNRTELDAVVARAQARVERIRELEFVDPVTVETVTREEFRSQSGGLGNVTQADRLHQNVKYESLFLVEEDTDAIEQLRENRAGGVLGFYDPTEDRIVVITDGGDADVDEFTLVHELVHALQDQHFDLTTFDRTTTEQNNAVNGLVEGEANLVEHRYEQRCEDEWLCPEPSGPGTAPPGFHFGLYFLNFQPYSDGPSFVQSLHDEGGWAAVNDAHENPPASTEQVIHPETYPDDEPTNVAVEDRSNERWRVPQLQGGVNYATFGEAGIFVMLYYPAYESQGERSVIPIGHLINDGPDSDLDPYNYDHRYSDGWDGDKLYPYVTNDSATTNETGYVWKTVWDGEEDARQFATGYVELLNVRGAEPVDGYRNTFRIPDDQRYGDAFYVDQTGDTVVIVNAPDAESLSGVREGAAPEEQPTPTPTPTASETGTSSANPTATAGDTRTEGTESGVVRGTAESNDITSPGFGVPITLAALAGAALLARRR